MIRGFLALQVFNLIISYYLNMNVQDPYMDEPFHIDQQFQYQNHNFGYWNPKLTTPPGLYLINYPFLKILTFFMPNTSLLVLCRLLNTFLYSNMSFYFLSFVFQNKVKAMLFVLLPTNYFYNFLFYTDSLSLMLIILAFMLINKGKLTSSGLVSIMSITVRQTNAVWIVYMCCWKFIDINRHKFLNKDPRLSYKFYMSTFINLIFTNLLVILLMFKVHILGVISTMIFIFINGGVVLGDQDHHRPVQHWAQLLYFVLFCFLQLPLTFQQYYQLSLKCLQRIRQSQNALTTAIVLLILYVYIVRSATYVHTFILSDNRHYIFYIWKNLFARYFYFRYLMVIPYTFSTIFIFRLITNTQDKIITLTLLILCISITLIPAELVEFRYFTVALMFLYCEIKVTPQAENLLSPINYTLLLFIFSNIIYLSIFVNREFVCSDGKGLCRFMF